MAKKRKATAARSAAPSARKENGTAKDRKHTAPKPDAAEQTAETDERNAELVEQDLPADEVLYDLAELFKLFGDSTRVKILYALFESELCVCDIARVLHLTQSAISHQLRILKGGKLVKYRREGKTVFYSLADDHVRSIIAMGLDHIGE